MAKFSASDLQLFKYLYDYKCLSLEQCWQAAYQNEFPSFLECSAQKLFPMISEGYLNYTADPFCKYKVTIGSTGIDAYRESLGLPRYKTDEWGRQYRTMKIPKDLRIRDGLVPHQISLNGFLLDFRDMYKKLGYETNYEIHMEKFVQDYDYFRPDATIEFPGLSFYIEQDMGTESRRQLSEKWSRYRRYLNARRGEKNLEKMIMFFVINYDTSSPPPHRLSFEDMEAIYDYRKKETYKTLTELFPDLIDKTMEIYAGTKDEILDAIKYRILPEYFADDSYEKETLIPVFKTQAGLRVSRAKNLIPLLSNVHYGYYLRKEENGKIVKSRNGNDIAFLTDNSLYFPISVFAKAAYISKANAYLHSLRPESPDIKYLIYTDDMKKLKSYLSFMGMDNIENVRIADANSIQILFE